jgi:hypothetical protein
MLGETKQRCQRGISSCRRTSRRELSREIETGEEMFHLVEQDVMVYVRSEVFNSAWFDEPCRSGGYSRML